MQGPHVREMHEKSHSVIPRLGTIIVAILILLRGCLRGGLLDGETLEPLLAVVPIQHLALEGLPDLTLLRGVFLFLLLSRRKASRLSSSVILRDRWPRVLNCRQILHESLDGLNQEN
jgi:hypothetical protein